MAEKTPLGGRGPCSQQRHGPAGPCRPRSSWKLCDASWQRAPVTSSHPAGPLGTSSSCSCCPASAMSASASTVPIGSWRHESPEALAPVLWWGAQCCPQGHTEGLRALRAWTLVMGELGLLRGPSARPCPELWRWAPCCQALLMNIIRSFVHSFIRSFNSCSPNLRNVPATARPQGLPKEFTNWRSL